MLVGLSEVLPTGIRKAPLLLISTTTTGVDVPIPKLPSTQTLFFTYNLLLKDTSPFVIRLESIETSVIKLLTPLALITNLSLATFTPSLVPKARLPDVS